jgi:ABC-2 type transport system permease protein
MVRYGKLLALFVLISIQNDAAYRFDFVMRAIVSALQMCGELLAIWTIFANTRSLGGWSVQEVIVLLGVFRLMHGLIGMTIAPNMRGIMEDIRGGTLDFVLTKPLDSQFYVSFRQFVLWRVTDIVLGLILAVVGAVALGRSVGPGQVVLFVMMLAAGVTIIYSIWLILATSVFWFTRINNIEMVFWNAFEAARYPVDIYRPWVRWALTFILPLAFLTTFPAGALVGRGGWYAVGAALLVAPALLATATIFWRAGLRRYSGASA